MEAEEESREGRREGEVRLKSWEEVKSQLAPVDLVKAVEEKEKEEEEEGDQSEEEEEDERRGAENQEDREDEAEECRSSPGATPSASSWPVPSTATSPPPLERSR